MTARWEYLSAADPCGIPIGRGQTCTKPGDHLDGCDWPLPRCKCSHGAATHTGGYGRCHSLSCACARYVDPPEDPALTASMNRHPAGKAREDKQ